MPGGYFGGYYPWCYGGLGLGGYYGGYYDPCYDPYGYSGYGCGGYGGGYGGYGGGFGGYGGGYDEPQTYSSSAADEGAVHLVGPYDPGVFHGTLEKGGLKVAGLPQLYVDLLHYERRGRELAEQLRREAMGY